MKYAKSLDPEGLKPVSTNNLANPFPPKRGTMYDEENERISSNNSLE